MGVAGRKGVTPLKRCLMGSDRVQSAVHVVPLIGVSLDLFDDSLLKICCISG